MSFSRVLACASLVLACFTSGCSASTESEETSHASLAIASPDALAALAELAGPYKGSWTMRGVDPSTGAERVVREWSDSVTTGKPIIEPGRVYMAMTSRMYVGSSCEPMEASWKEGFLVERDGSVGPRFVDMAGHVVIEEELAPNVFTFRQTATSQELGQLGFVNVVSGEHVTVKVVAKDPSGTEIDSVTRVTTVSWRTNAGENRVTQLVTLQGRHQRGTLTQCGSGQ